VPLDIAVRVQSDEGVPIVVSHPDSPSAAAYTSIACRVWDKLQAQRGAAAGNAGPKITVS
jgi:MinD-like ATPase involved in chromosome partitioning or flagellar assembly